MAPGTRAVEIGPSRLLGSAEAAIVIGEMDRPEGSWRGRRCLSVDGRAAFELSSWCGTCGFVFERLEGANGTLSMAELQESLNSGLSGIDANVVGVVSQVLPEGRYSPLLLEIGPTLVYPLQPGDYFAEEKVATWGVDPFWGLPTYPRTPYYRGEVKDLGIREMNAAVRLFEFVVPMVPPSWNDAARVDEYVERLQNSSTPTCVALAVLDVNRPAVDHAGVTAPDVSHWALAHFLLDGHHKMAAAAKAGRRVRLLTFLAEDASLADHAQVGELLRSFASR